MRDYENIPEMISENPPDQRDPYTYYAGHSATAPVPRYVPKQKKKKQPWGLILVIALSCSLLGGAAGAGGVLLMQHMQAEKPSETDVSYMM